MKFITYLKTLLDERAERQRLERIYELEAEIAALEAELKTWSSLHRAGTGGLPEYRWEWLGKKRGELARLNSLRASLCKA